MAGKKKTNSNGANVGYEADLWRMAEAAKLDAAIAANLKQLGYGG